MSQILTKNLLTDLDRIEDQVQRVRIRLMVVMRKNRKNTDNIIEQTSGLLGKNFLKGVDFENEARKSWSKRTKRLGL